ncbi:MAG: anhydro-N-acetylmuramic acid kinase [Candidatus Riflebacteria bacterium]
MKNLKVLGMMSGTSGDGIDGALVEFGEDGSFSLLWTAGWPFTQSMRDRIQRLMGQPSLHEALLGHSYVAHLYSEACRAFFSQGREKPDYIAAHGQTILHVPQTEKWDGYRVNGSLQLLNGSLLAQQTGVPVICNFREADMAAEGQGAPLVPFADACFFGHHLSSDRIVLNVGGIANITLLRPEDGRVKVVSAFDTGPGNMMMDSLIEQETGGEEHYDRDGRLAASAVPDHKMVEEFLVDPYFSLLPPKSTGREKFGKARMLEILPGFSSDAGLAEKISTFLEITCRSIVDAIIDPRLGVKFPAPLIVAGGGALNLEMMKRLAEKLQGKCVVSRSDEYGVPVMAREAMAFAALGNAFVRSMSANILSATGAKKQVILGQLHPVF